MDHQSSNVVNGAMYKMGPCGGGGGTVTDMDMTGVTRIIMIRINSSTTINSLSILFERNGQQEWTPKWGEKDGGTISEIILSPSEYFTSVTGHVGVYPPAQSVSVVSSLTFVTNYRTFGPYGKKEGAPFQLPAAGGKIIGFHGRTGYLIDAFGTYVE